MGIITDTTNFIFLHTPGNPVEYWAVYEHRHRGEVIYIGYCELRMVETMEPARHNSEWMRITQLDQFQPVTVNVKAITDNEQEARHHAITLITSRAALPICNERGYNVKRASKRIMGSNGKTYTNQSEAAKDLGVSQSLVSLHLSGRAKTVNGITLAYGVRPHTPREDLL